MKKLLSLLLVLLLTVSLVSCISVEIPNNGDNQSEDTLTNDTTASQSSDTVSQNSNTVSGSKPQSQKPNNSQSSVSQGGTVIEKPIESKPDSTHTVSSPEIEYPKEPDTPHSPVKKDDYFQYSRLSATEKRAYNDICEAIETTQNVIPLKKYSLTIQKLSDIYEKLLSDNPQYFWVTKFLSYSIEKINSEEYVCDLYLFYTDGEISDDIDNYGELTTIADRDKISQQIKTFNLKAESFLTTVSSNLSDVEKEKKVHDFIIATVSYDYDAVSLTPTRENYPRVWDAYGTLCNGRAVCEGYARLFQYLCCQLGINAIYTYGTSMEQPHAWNAVSLDDEWYYVDVTWDDGSTDSIPLYDWFNITTKKLLEDHTIDSSVLAVPTASCEDYSFQKTFGVNIKAAFEPPENYEQAIDYMVKENADYLVLVLNGNKINSLYLTKYVFSNDSVFNLYIKSKGYALTFDSYYSLTDSCIYLKRK